MIAFVLGLGKAINTPAGRMLAGAVLAVIVLGYAYHQGRASAGGEWERAALEAQIARLQHDIEIQENARRRAEVIARTANDRAAAVQERLNSYEAERAGAAGDLPPLTDDLWLRFNEVYQAGRGH